MLSSHQKRQILGRSQPDAAAQGLRFRASRVALLTLCATGLMGLAGCGQKGPLYLPGTQPGGTNAVPGSPIPDNDQNNLPAVNR